jgi:hypothetical protein
VKIRLLQFQGCPNSAPTLRLLEEVLEAEGVRDEVEVVEVADAEAAARERFLGSPSVQIDGHDIEVGRRDDPPAFGCRVYGTGEGASGVPPEEMIRRAVRAARRSASSGPRRHRPDQAAARPGG